MYRILVTVVWLLIFSFTILGIGTSLAAVIHYMRPHSITVPQSWHTTAIIAGAFLAGAALLRAIWPKMVFTTSDFIESVNRAGGNVECFGRQCSASFASVKVLYYFQRGFVGFDVLWMGPKYSPKRKWIEKQISDNGGRIEACHLWSLVAIRAPVVLQLTAKRWSDVDSKAVIESLKEVSGGREVELWVKREEASREIVQLLETGQDVTLHPPDEILIVVYVPPWEREPIRRVLRVACSLGEYDNEKVS